MVLSFKIEARQMILCPMQDETYRSNDKNLLKQ